MDPKNVPAESCSWNYSQLHLFPRFVLRVLLVYGPMDSVPLVFLLVPFGLPFLQKRSYTLQLILYGDRGEEYTIPVDRFKIMIITFYPLFLDLPIHQRSFARNIRFPATPTSPSLPV